MITVTEIHECNAGDFQAVQKMVKYTLTTGGSTDGNRFPGNHRFARQLPVLCPQRRNPGRDAYRRLVQKPHRNESMGRRCGSRPCLSGARHRQGFGGTCHSICRLLWSGCFDAHLQSFPHSRQPALSIPAFRKKRNQRLPDETEIGRNCAVLPYFLIPFLLLLQHFPDMLIIRIDRIDNLLPPSGYQHPVHRFGKPRHLSPFHLWRHG